MTFACEAFDPELGALATRAWTPGTPLQLRAAHGARALTARLLDAGDPVYSVEVPADGADVVSLQLAPGKDGQPPRVFSGDRRVLRLPAETHLTAPRRPRPALPLDLVFVLDATLQTAAPPSPEHGEDGSSLTVRAFDPTLRNGPIPSALNHWAGQLDALVNGPGSRMALLAFGDEPAPFPTAEDLRPAFHLFPPPRQRRFQGLDRQRFKRLLAAVPPSSGGDAVDAVADALHVAAALPWADASRRLVVLVGDSPGFSVDSPPPRGSSWLARKNTVEAASDALFAQEVDVATCFITPGPDAVISEARAKLLEYTAEQYRRIASSQAWSFVAEAADLATFTGSLEKLMATPPWLGHGSTAGLYQTPSEEI